MDRGEIKGCLGRLLTDYLLARFLFLIARGAHPILNLYSAKYEDYSQINRPNALWDITDNYFYLEWIFNPRAYEILSSVVLGNLRRRIDD